MCTEDDLVYAYTTDQAIEDGVLVHPFPDRWPWLLITESVHNGCLTASEFDERSYDQVLVPLLMDCIMQVQKLMKNNPDGVDFAKLDHTVVGTVWIKPNDKKGMTVMLPEDY
jgi:hypothetical protein